MEHYDGYYRRQCAQERHFEYRRLIHDLSKKLSSENVQSISFLRHSSTDCYGYPPTCAHIPVGTAHGPHGALSGPTNRGLEVLEQLWQKGVFNENNLEPLVKLLRDIGRHDLADECKEKSGQLYRVDLHRLPRPPPLWIPNAQPMTVHSPAFRDGVKSEKDTDDPKVRDDRLTETIPSTSPVKLSQQDVSVSACSSSVPPRLYNTTNNSIDGNNSSSFPNHFNFDATHKDVVVPLSPTTADVRQAGLETSMQQVAITLSKLELDKLLQCVERDADLKLKEKLISAVSTHRQGQDRGESKLNHQEPLVLPKVVTKSENNMSTEAVDFDSQMGLSSQLQLLPDPNNQNCVLRRQKSVLHVKSIDIPIPAPLTPQPQRSHKKLEACNSNSSTDSGLSQCHSHRSSTISNTSSSSVFLSEDEDDQKETRDDDHTLTTDDLAVANHVVDKATTPNTPASTVAVGGLEHAAERDKAHTGSRRSGQITVKQSEGKAERKLRRQSEITRDGLTNKGEKHEMKRGHPPLYCKRNRAISMPELPPLNPLAKTGMTIDWRIPRDDFIDPIFHHKSKLFEKKCRFSTGSGPSLLSVQLAIRLFANGINWDQGSYSTLKVEITNTSRPPPESAYILFDIKGYDCHAGHIIASRQVEYPLKNKEFLVPEFLSHEVIKVSHTKNFEFRATIKIKYLVCRDWVVIATDQAGTSCYAL